MSTPKCPSCQGYDVEVVDGQRAVCWSCTECRILQFQFCVACQREWPRYTSTTSACKLPNCALRAALLSDEKINQPNSPAEGCPFFRACPGCKALLTYIKGICPNIRCPHCETNFCFRCLNHSLNHRAKCKVLDNKQSLKDLE